VAIDLLTMLLVNKPPSASGLGIEVRVEDLTACQHVIRIDHSLWIVEMQVTKEMI